MIVVVDLNGNSVTVVVDLYGYTMTVVELNG